MSLELLDIDTATFRIDGGLDEVARDRFEHGKWSQRFRDEPGTDWRGQLGPDILVRENLVRGEIFVSGSPHKDVLGESVGPFGPDQLSDWVDGFAAKCGLTAEQVRSGRVSRFDVAANLDVEACPADYIRIARPPPRMRSVGSGATTATFKNRHGQAEITLYDKVQKIKDRGKADTVPPSWAGRNVLRAEVRFKKPKLVFKRKVTVGMLCDAAFWAEVAGQYERQALSVQIRRGQRALPVPVSVPEMRRMYAAGHIESSGGAEVALERVSQALRRGQIPAHQAKRQRHEIRSIHRDYAPGNVDLADEFEAKVHGAVARSSGVWA